MPWWAMLFTVSLTVSGAADRQLLATRKCCRWEVGWQQLELFCMAKQKPSEPIVMIGSEGLRLGLCQFNMDIVVVDILLALV